MLKVLPTLFPHLLGTTSSAPVELYDKFQREADERDRDFVKKYGEDLDTTLIFVGFPSLFPRLFCGVDLNLLGDQVGLFSGVTSVFIVDVESQLQPDFTQSSYIVLTIIASISLATLQSTSIPFCPNGPVPILPLSTLKRSFMQVWLPLFLPRSSPCWENSGSTVTPTRRCVDLSLIVIGTDRAR